MLRVHLLGGLGLEVDGAPLEPPASRRARSVLAWLALNRGSHPRVEVAGRFWPDLADASARGNLRLAIWAIRQALGPAAGSYLLATRDEVGFVSNGVIWVDLLEFRRLVGEGRDEEALELCRGEPLAELEDEWVYEPREEHREQVVEVLGRLAAEAEERGDIRSAIGWNRRQVALDPLGEEVARELMRRLAATGDRGAALAAFERLRERLERDLGIAPSRATRELAYRLGVEGDEEPAPESPPASPPAEPARATCAVPWSERTPLVGRRHELDVLHAELGRACGGELRVVLLGGEAGMGKTRLATELAREAAARGATVLLGHNDEEAVVPFQPFVEALGRYARSAALDELREVAGGDPWELARLLPDLQRRLPSPPPLPGRPEAERYQMFEAVTALLRALSARAPVLLVLDDLHWADTPTLLLLKHVARSADPSALLVLGTFRQAEAVTGRHLADLLGDLRRDASVTRLSLGGLEETEVRELIGGWWDGEPPESLVRALHRDTGGNPFFLQETLRHLEEAGLLRAGDERWASVFSIEQIGVAEGVKEVVARRLATLGSACRRLLDLGAVVGRAFELELLERLSGTSADEIADTLEEAVRARILGEDDDAAALRYTFSHALIRQTLYESLPRSRRVRLHRAIADAIEDLHAEDLDPRLGDLAYHVLRSARPRDAQQALDYARRAGAHAMEVLAYEEGASHYRHALEALQLSPRKPGRERCEILLDLGAALARSGDADEAAAVFEDAAAAARTLRRHDLLALAALGVAGTWALARVEVDPRCVALLEEALTALGDSEPVLRARVLTRLSEELYYSPARERRAELSAEALRLVRRSGDRRALAAALGARHTAVWAQHLIEERLELANEMARLGDDADDLEIAFQGAAWSFADLLELGRVDEADEALVRLTALADDLRQPAYRWWAHLLRATRAGMAGEFDEAEVQNEQAAFWGRRAHILTAEMYATGQLHYLRLDQGRAEEVVATTRELTRSYPAVTSLRCMLAEACAETGREDEARREMRAMADDETAQLMMNASWSIGTYSLSMACVRLQDAVVAESLYHALIDHERYCHVAFRAASFAGSVSRTLGLLAATAGRTDHAARHLARAVEVNERIGARCQLAFSHRDYGRLLNETGRPDAASEHLSSAARLSHTLGMQLEIPAPGKSSL